MATKDVTRPRHRKGSGVKVRGFFRVRIVEQDGRISGDTDWFENTVTNLGKRDYLCTRLAGGASRPISFMALGTGTDNPIATDTSLQGEISHSTAASRCRWTVNTSQVGSTAIEFQATFQSALQYVTTTVAIRNIMVINSTTSAGTIFAASTYAISTLNTNQDVQASYRITFA